MYTRILDSKQCYHIGHRLELKYVFFTHFWRNFHQGLNSLSFVAHAQGRKFQINSDQFQIIGIFKNILDKRVLICKLLLKKEQWLRSRTTSTGRELQISGLAAGKRWLIGGNFASPRRSQRFSQPTCFAEPLAADFGSGPLARRLWLRLGRSAFRSSSLSQRRVCCFAPLTASFWPYPNAVAEGFSPGQTPRRKVCCFAPLAANIGLGKEAMAEGALLFMEFASLSL